MHQRRAVQRKANHIQNDFKSSQRSTSETCCGKQAGLLGLSCGFVFQRHVETNLAASPCNRLFPLDIILLGRLSGASHISRPLQQHQRLLMLAAMCKVHKACGLLVQENGQPSNPTFLEDSASLQAFTQHLLEGFNQLEPISRSKSSAHMLGLS